MSGAKAANLARLMGLGFPVPAGVVVPAAAFTAHTAEGVPDTLPPSLVEELYELVESIVPVAVRSSGVAEDLDGASFAGQYETVLGVDGREALSAAVLQCWESAHDPRRAPQVDVTSRIRTRARQRRLSPPLVIGKVNKFMESTQRGSIAAMRSPAAPGEHIVGMPASPGRVTGPARVVRGPAEFDRLLPGEVLVAREYGLPAVVSAEGATARLRDGVLVTVDGSAGTVELAA